MIIYGSYRRLESNKTDKYLRKINRLNKQIPKLQCKLSNIKNQMTDLQQYEDRKARSKLTKLTKKYSKINNLFHAKQGELYLMHHLIRCENSHPKYIL